MPLSGIQLIDAHDVPAHKRRLYMQASLIAILGNLVLLLAKGMAAQISGSSAIHADAANSAADVAYSVFMGLGLWLLSRAVGLYARPSDARARRVFLASIVYLSAILILMVLDRGPVGSPTMPQYAAGSIGDLPVATMPAD